jgi:hypothetical protein
MGALEDVEALKTRLLTQWSKPLEKADRPAGDIALAQFDSFEPESKPRAGLAVGHSIDPDNGEVRVEMRVTASQGPNLTWARKLAEEARSEGYEVNLRSIPPPMIDPGPERPAGQLMAAAGGRQPTFPGHFRPLRLGSSVSHESGPTGTIGAFMALEGGHVGILSCCHVLARAGKAEKGDFVHQPGAKDQQPFVAENRIGRLTGMFAPLVASQPSNLDAAIAQLSPEMECQQRCNVVPDMDFIPDRLHGKPITRFGEQMATLTRGIRVAKIGRSSGYTEGLLTSPGMEFQTGLRGHDPDDRFAFSRVLEVTSDDAQSPFAIGGDSGSLVFTLTDCKALGIHFCSIPIDGESSLNYIMPMDRICGQFKIEMLIP